MTNATATPPDRFSHSKQLRALRGPFLAASRTCCRPRRSVVSHGAGLQAAAVAVSGRGRRRRELVLSRSAGCGVFRFLAFPLLWPSLLSCLLLRPSLPPSLCPSPSLATPSLPCERNPRCCCCFPPRHARYIRYLTLLSSSRKHLRSTASQGGIESQTSTVMVGLDVVWFTLLVPSVF